MTRQFLRATAAIWIAAITVGSVMPTKLKIALGTTTEIAIQEGFTTVRHQLIHFFAFGLAALWLLLLARARRGEWTAALFVIGLGAGLELVEHYMGDQFEWLDLADDAAGALAFLMLVRYTAVRARLISENRPQRAYSASLLPRPH